MATYEIITKFGVDLRVEHLHLISKNFENIFSYIKANIWSHHRKSYLLHIHKEESQAKWRIIIRECSHNIYFFIGTCTTGNKTHELKP